MIPLRQSTASQEIPLGRFLDSTDGDTEETGLTIANTDIKLWKMGTTTWASKNSGGGTHDANGLYHATLDATDTNTLGGLRIDIHVAGALANTVHCWVFAATVYDALVAGSANFLADMLAISGDATAADNLESQYDTTGLTGDNFPSKQSQLSAIANTGAATNKPASEDNTGGAIKGISFVGAQTGVFGATEALDGAVHLIDDAGNAIDIIYGFDVGGDGVPTSITWTGFVNNNNDDIQVFGYDFATPGWVQIGTIEGKNSSSNQVEVFNMFTAMVGTTGADTGKVYLRFEETGQSGNFALNTDQVFVSFASVPAGLGYQGGQVWVDTVSGASGTVVGSNGTSTNPVDNLADARTIADAINIKRVHLLPGSSVTLAQEFDNHEFRGQEYTVALGGQSVSGAVFEHAIITGNDSGTNAIETNYFDCAMGGNTLGDHHFHGCALEGNITLAEAADYFWDQCFSAIAGTDTPSIDFQAAVETKNFSNRHYSGGLEYKNFGAGGGTHTSSLEGDGQYILNANCAGGTLAVRGNFDKTDNSGDAVTIVETARYDQTQVENAVWDAVLTNILHAGATTAGKRLRSMTDPIVRTNTAQGSGTGNNQIQLDTGASAIDGAYDPASIHIINGTGSGQSRGILEYDGSTKIATLNRNWKVNPAADSEFVITAWVGHDHVNEGLARGSTDNTITLNALASAQDDVYIGQLIFIVSGTGDDQVGLVTDYDGGAQVATIEGPNNGNWATNPDTTSGYVMLPQHVHQNDEFAAAIWDAAKSSHVQADSMGEAIQSNVTLNNAQSYEKGVSAKVPTGLLDSDGNLVELQTVTAEVSKDLGAFAATDNAVVELSDGVYSVTLTATEFDADIVLVKFVSAGNKTALFMTKTSEK